jgi:PBSX family phage terminase large subunit
MSIAITTPEHVIPAPELRGAAWQLGSCHDMEVLLDGPGGTGKTYAILYYIHLLLLKYPGAKWLVCRKYNVDLAGSAMATYQNDVLDPNEGVYYYGGSKVKPAGYIYPNGSFLAVSGLDRPSKLKSFECDGVYINEATEVEIDDLEIARMRLRKGVIPWQQIIMDTNPDAPGHWLNQRMMEGATTRLVSRHEDNPRYFSATTQDWTEDGRKYIFGILGGLTGVRLARFRYGIWAAAEGTIYEDSWDRSRNVISRFTIPPEWPRYMVIDFGFTNPFVCLWAAIDPDGRIIIYRQIYMTKRLVEDHAKVIKQVSRWGQPGGDPLPREIICDHDAEGRATLERHLGLMTMPAHKPVLEGIQAMASRLKPAGDGKPRFMVMEGCLVERDMELAKEKKPTCLEDEPEVYVWHVGPNVKAKEEPVKEFDHGCDCGRYLCARFDLDNHDVSYFPSVWR